MVWARQEENACFLLLRKAETPTLTMHKVTVDTHPIRTDPGTVFKRRYISAHRFCGTFDFHTIRSGPVPALITNVVNSTKYVLGTSNPERPTDECTSKETTY